MEEHAGTHSATTPGAAGTTITSAMEDYLKAIYKIDQSGATVTTQRLAEVLGLSAPSVTNMVKRLHEYHLVSHTPYQGVTLTEAGEKVALEVVRHHRLLELYLATALGFPWDEVHDEAEKLEHYVSDELERRMEQALGYPQFDPHGDPIPTREGAVPATSDMTLAELPVRTVATGSRVSDSDAALLRYLGDLGLVPGAGIVVGERMRSEGPIRLRSAQRAQALGVSAARSLHGHVDRPNTSSGEPAQERNGEHGG
jgi:DtxR family Mn-dependent transcriptional regulator